jgi:valyl-tRNA synthetase
MSGEKMSKSLGNVALAHELLKTYAGRGDPLGAAQRPLPPAAGLDAGAAGAAGATWRMKD